MLAEILRDAGYQVIVYTFHSFATQANLPGIDIFYHKSTAELKEVFRKSDLIISNGELSLKCVMHAMLLHKKVICFYHMALPYIKDRPGIKNSIQNIIRRFIVTYPVRHITVSNAVTRALKLPKKISAKVIYNPVRSEALTLINESKHHSLPQPEYDILFCGRFIEGKGVLILADALKILAKKNKSVRVLMIGEGKEEDFFKQKTALLESISIDFKPFLAIGELIPEFNKARVMVLPSYLHKEGSPLTLIEFMFTGKPVVISDQPAMIETCGNTALVAKQGDALSLAEAIDQILSDERLYKELSFNTIAESSKFDPDNFRNEIIQLIKESFYQ